MNSCITMDPAIANLFREEVRTHVSAALGYLRQWPAGRALLGEAAHGIRGAAAIAGREDLARLAAAVEDALAGEPPRSALTWAFTLLERACDDPSQAADIKTLTEALTQPGGENEHRRSEPLPVHAVSTSESDEPSLQDLFRAEAGSRVTVLTRGLLALEQGDLSGLREMMAATHSLKGAAKIAGFPKLVGLAHQLEDELVSVQRLNRPPEAAAIDRMLAMVDSFNEAARGDQRTPLPKRQVETTVEERPLSGETHDSLARLVDNLSTEMQHLAEVGRDLFALERKQQKLVAILERFAVVFGAGGSGSTPIEQAYSLSRECEQQLSKRVRDLETRSTELAEVADQMQRKLIAGRQVPFGMTGLRINRTVRDLVRELDKEVHLEIVGEDVAIDRDLLRELEGPLNHLIFNALDHGVENRSQRRAAGKHEVGLLRLSAERHAGRLRLTVEDDGRGIALERLRRTVVERAWLSHEQAALLDREALLAFLFRPGFSTADHISEISGRGVGLDAVHSSVTALGGKIRIETEPGRFTRISLLLPLSVNTAPVHIFEVQGRKMAIPSSRVIAQINLPLAELASQGDWYHFHWNDRRLGLVTTEALPENSQTLPVLICASRDHYVGLAVEKLEPHQDLIMRPLDRRCGEQGDRQDRGHTLDGTTVRLFDLDRQVRAMELHTLGLDALERDDRQVRGRILVAEDAVTVREMERQLLERAGFAVTVAIDGKDAWQQLLSRNFDLVITDMDMPRMSGLELIQHIRAKRDLRELPILVLSFKERRDDLEALRKAGADCHLSKRNFRESLFLGAVEDLLTPRT